MEKRIMDDFGNFVLFSSLTKKQKNSVGGKEFALNSLKQDLARLRKENSVLRSQLGEDVALSIDPHNTVPLTDDTTIPTPSAPAKGKSKLAGAKSEAIVTEHGADVTMEIGGTPETTTEPNKSHPGEQLNMDL